MNIGSIKSIAIKNISKADGSIIKEAVDSMSGEVLGQIKATKYINSRYCRTKLIPFYTEIQNTFDTIARPHLYVDDLFVKETARNKGIGASLVKDMVKESYTRGCEGRLILVAGNPEKSPLPFYRKIGFSTGNKKFDAKLDEIIKYKEKISNDIQSFMMLPKKIIAQIIKAKA